MIDRYNTNQEMKGLWSDTYKYKVWAKIEQLVADAWFATNKDFADIEILIDDDIADAVADRECKTGHEMTAFLGIIGDHYTNIRVDGISPLHYGLTSSDVMDTALSYAMKQASDVIYGLLFNFEQGIRPLIHQHKDTLCVGRTHGQHAIPMHFADRLDKYRRAIHDLQSFLSGLEYYGKLSGPIGTHNTISDQIEKEVLDRLELSRTDASTQIIPRYMYARVISTLAMIASQLEKIAVDIRLMSQPEIYEVTEGSAKKRDGSSSMPHKKNPISCEKICSLARMVRSNAGIAMENIVTWFERDLANSANERIYIADSYILLAHMIETLTKVFSDLDVHTDKMKQNVISSPDVLSAVKLDNAIKNGMSREDAYRAVKSGDITICGQIEDVINKNYFK